MVSKKLLDELKEIIKEEYGEVLPSKELAEVGNGVVQFVELLIKIEYEPESEITNNYE